MKVITAIEEYNPNKDDISVFLSGGISNCSNWQKGVIESLEFFRDSTEFSKSTLFDNFIVFNPRRENFPIDNPNASQEQIEWEFNMLEKMDIFSMYFCNADSDQPICMYELGRNIVRMQNRFPIDWKKRIVVGVEDGYRRKNDVLVQTALATGYSVSVNEYFDIDGNSYILHASRIIDSLVYLRGY